MAQVTKSALRRTLTGRNATATPLAYWPLEDGTDVDRFGAVAGPPLLITNSAYVFPGTVAATGTAPYAEFEASSNTSGGGVQSVSLTGLGFDSTKFSVTLVMTGTMPSPTITTMWRLFAIRTSSGATCYVNAFCATSGGVVGTNFGVDVWFDGGTGARAFSFGSINPFDGEQHSLLCTWEQVGADVTVTMSLDGVAGTSDTETGQTLGSPTLLEGPSPRELIFGDTGNNTGGSVGLGHRAVWGNATPTDPYEASTGYNGEQAHVRITRIIAEEGGIPFHCTAARSARMGPQDPGTLLNLLRECEAVDGGVLYEKRWGLAYQSLDERYNAPVGLALDFAQGHIAEEPEPADDDQSTVNRFTASRPSGSEFTAEQTTGPMGTGAEGPGVYDGSAQLNVQFDTQLKQQAEHRVLLGTIDEDRYPNIGLNFAHNPDLIDTWTALGYGARVTVDNPLAQMPPGQIDQVIEGHSERWDQFVWTASLNCSPFSPYRVFILAETTGDSNPFLGYMVPTTCVLAEDLDTTETGVDITTDPLWTTDADDWTPGALITIGGEDMTVTGVSGGSNPQTLTVVRSVNTVVKAHSAGATVAFKHAGNLAL